MIKTIFSLFIFFLLISPVLGGVKPFIQVDGGVSLLLSPEWYRVGWDDALGVSGGGGLKINDNIELGARFAYRKFPTDVYPLDIIGIYARAVNSRRLRSWGMSGYCFLMRVKVV